METRYTKSSDGAKIAFNTYGEGPALFLVHGAADPDYCDKSMWIKNGWVDILKEHFFVIAPDLRGYGESEKSKKIDFYSIENTLNDFKAISKECGVDEYYYFGWSYGTTVGLQACKYIKEIKKAVCAGGAFGDIFFKELVPMRIKRYKDLDTKKKNNKLQELNTTEQEREWIEKTDFEVKVALYEALASWKGVEPNDIEMDMALYVGSNEGEIMLKEMDRRKIEMKQNNICYKIFKNLDHFDIINETETVMPWILDFYLK